VAEPGIPQRVRLFIIDHVDSLVELEIVLLLHRSAQRDFAVADIARELRIDSTWVASQLGNLHAAGILSCTEGPDARYRFDPHSPELRETVGELATTFATHRVSMTALIYSKPPGTLRSFADAFRLRKERTDG
jgi:predicted transcriptional regulator